MAANSKDRGVKHELLSVLQVLDFFFRVVTNGRCLAGDRVYEMTRIVCTKSFSAAAIWRTAGRGVGLM